MLLKTFNDFFSYAVNSLIPAIFFNQFYFLLESNKFLKDAITRSAYDLMNKLPHLLKCYSILAGFTLKAMFATFTFFAILTISAILSTLTLNTLRPTLTLRTLFSSNALRTWNV